MSAPEAMRHRQRGKTHLRHGLAVRLTRRDFVDRRDPIAVCGYTVHEEDVEWVPAEQAAPEDRCQRCWRPARDRAACATPRQHETANR